MKHFWLIVLMITTVSSNSGYGLYGVDEDANLYKYDILLNGSNSSFKVSTTPNYYFTGNALGVIDKNLNIYYALIVEVTSWYYSIIVPFQLNGSRNSDIQPYSPIHLPSLYACSVADGDKAITINQNTGELYILGPKTAQSESEMILLNIKFDPLEDNAIINQIGPSYTNMSFKQVTEGGMSTYDTKRNMLWFSLINDDLNRIYYHINTTNGVVNNTLILKRNGNNGGVWYDALYFDKMDIIIGIICHYSETSNNITFQFVYLDPISLDIVKIFDAFDGVQAIYSDMTIDYKNHLFYAVFVYGKTEHQQQDGYLVQIDINNGTIVSKQEFCGIDFGSIECPSSMQLWQNE